MYTKFRVYFLIREASHILHSHLATTKSSSYPSSIALQCRQKLRRDITPPRLEEVTELAE